MSDADRCDAIVFEHGDTYRILAPMTKADAERLVAADRAVSPDFVCDWHFVAGRAVFKRIARDRYARLAAVEQERETHALQDICDLHSGRGPHRDGCCRLCGYEHLQAMWAAVVAATGRGESLTPADVISALKGIGARSATPAPDPETGLAALREWRQASSLRPGNWSHVPEAWMRLVAAGDALSLRLEELRRAALARPDAQPCEWCARGLCEKHGNNEEDRPDAGEDGA
jgi:hypothetical protein